MKNKLINLVLKFVEVVSIAISKTLVQVYMLCYLMIKNNVDFHNHFLYTHFWFHLSEEQKAKLDNERFQKEPKEVDITNIVSNFIGNFLNKTQPKQITDVDLKTIDKDYAEKAEKINVKDPYKKSTIYN